MKMDLSTGEKWVKIASDDEEGEEEIQGVVHDPSIADGGGVNEKKSNNIKVLQGGGGGGGANIQVQGGDNDVVQIHNTDIKRKKIVSATMDASGALTILPNDDVPKVAKEGSAKEDATNNQNDGATNNKETFEPVRDYNMMHRVMSQLPPEELQRYGGLPELPSTTTTNTTNIIQLTAEERKAFETKMERLWKQRQEELMQFQQNHVANLPRVIKERIGVLREYVEDGSGRRRELLEKLRLRQLKNEQIEEDSADGEDNAEVNLANDIVSALKDLEFQLSDVDMARDFHTLGGWPYLVMLLDDRVHQVAGDDAHSEALVYEIQTLAAMTIGTAVGNLEEFRTWALEDISTALNVILRDGNDPVVKSSPTSALSLLSQSFEQELNLRSQQMGHMSMAVDDNSNKARATYKLRAIYALGSLLRGNPMAQQQFVSNNFPDVLVRNVLGTLSNVRGDHVSKMDYKFASRVLALGEDIVMDVLLHQEDYTVQNEGVVNANQLVASFTTEPWCELSLRMLAPPIDLVGESQGRSMKERALSAVRALGPACREQQCANDDGSNECQDELMWGIQEVKSLRSEWNREGSGDGLDSVYRRELLDLVDGVLDVLQQ